MASFSSIKLDFNNGILNFGIINNHYEFSTCTVTYKFNDYIFCLGPNPSEKAKVTRVRRLYDIANILQVDNILLLNLVLP